MKYLAALLLLATHGALSAPLEARQCAAGADGLHVRAAQYGKYFGTAVDNPALSDAGYMAALRNTSDFGQLTVGNPQKVRLILTPEITSVLARQMLMSLNSGTIPSPPGITFNMEMRMQSLTKL